MSLKGEIEIYRNYFKCTKCGKTYIPYDDFLGIGSSMLNKQSAKAFSWLSIFMPFDHVKAYSKDIMGIEISETCLKETTQRLGTHLHKEMESKSNNLESINTSNINPNIMYIQADGSMVPIRGEKEREFKEVKLGLIFTDKDIIQRKTKKGDISVDINNKRFVSSIGEGVESFKKMMFTAACEKGYESSKHVIVLSDGASWISKMKYDFFPKAIHILDWYHAIEHLWETARKLFGETKKEKCEQWVEPLKELLWNGKVNDVIKELEKQIFILKKNQKVLIQLRGYYVSNKNNMKYDEYRKNGFYIGSGAIESAHKYIVASRLKQAGMRWTLSHANAMIWLRSKYFENEWSIFWQKMDLKDYLRPIKKGA